MAEYFRLFENSNEFTESHYYLPSIQFQMGNRIQRCSNTLHSYSMRIQANITKLLSSAKITVYTNANAQNSELP